jgi:hypothetical protein
LSPRLTSRSRDLQALVADGYCVEIRDNQLLIHDVPYVTAAAAVAYGTLVSPLDLANDVTVPPGTHVAWWIGEHPCHSDGRVMTALTHSGAQALSATVHADHSFSHKPPGSHGYPHYFAKMTTYIAMISQAAELLDPTVTARTYRVVPSEGGTGPFLYADTASSRAGLGPVSAKLAGCRVAIIGVGGTGSYLLDLLAKTLIDEIHLFDDDRFLQHNAFRAPGPTAASELEGGPYKVDLHAARWATMRTGVIAHRERGGAAHIELLAGMDMVFVCVDCPTSRRELVAVLETCGAAFIDTGMGLILVEAEAQVLGQVRVTTSTPGTREAARTHLPTVGEAADDIYASNIQVAELNALNAVMAVVKFKKLRGFYTDLEVEHDSVFTLDGNAIVNTGGRP